MKILRSLLTLILLVSSESLSNAQSIIPPPPTFPTPEPTPLEPQPTEPPLEVPPSPTQPIPENLSGSLTVTAFDFIGNTVFTSQELGNIPVILVVGQ